MVQAARVNLRYPLLALAAGDLVLLGMRLRPWSEIPNLPGQGSIAYDPAVCLVAYIVFMFWIPRIANLAVRQAISFGTLFGIPAGLLLLAHVLIGPGPGTPSLVLHMALLVGAGLLWAIAGFRAAQEASNFSMGIVGGAWSGMMSALLACAAVLAQIGMNPLPPQSPVSWTQYQALAAIGPPITQALAHGLNLATGFLLFCPLVGAVLGVICGLGRKETDAPAL